MTIAGCYLSPEGVVLGADSTASLMIAPAPGSPESFHYFNFNQKLFEIGENGTLGVLTWGLGALPDASYRTLIAHLADDLKTNPATTVSEVADRWTDLFWPRYSTTCAAQLLRCAGLVAKAPFGTTPALPNVRTKAEEDELLTLRLNYGVGFCIGGHLTSDRMPAAFEIKFDPTASVKPASRALPMHNLSFWGAPNPFQRLIFGADQSLIESILKSGKWTGTDQELFDLVRQQAWSHPTLPIREAVDFVHSCIYSTIKAFKFSRFNQICGGPIEIAVITTDRAFRWVKHKSWDAAIEEV